MKVEVGSWLYPPKEASHGGSRGSYPVDCQARAGRFSGRSRRVGAILRETRGIRPPSARPGAPPGRGRGGRGPQRHEELLPRNGRAPLRADPGSGRPLETPRDHHRPQGLRQRRRHFARKRGGGRIRGESLFARTDPEEGRDEGIGAVLGREPTPELAAMVAEDCRRMLDRLGDETLRLVARQTLEGYSTAEIAAKIGCSQRSVQRKLDTIREIWSEFSAEETSQ